MPGRVSIPFISVFALMLASCAEQATPPSSSVSSPSASTATGAPPASAQDLSGLWAFSSGGKLTVQQTGNRIVAIFTEGNSLCSPGHKYIDARIDGARLVGTRWVCNRPDTADLVAQIDRSGRRISFSIPNFGLLEMTR